MADHDPSTQPPAEPSGSAEARLAALQTLENGEATKQSQMKWVDGANYGMLGADVGYGVYAAGSAAMGAGATGAAAAGAAAVAAVPAVVALGGSWLLGKMGVTGKLEEGFEWVGDKLGLTIGRGDPHPACVGDDIAHSSGFWGMVAGLAVGVAIGAMVAATVATGGLAGALLVGACMAGGLSIGGALAGASQNMGSNCGKIATGSGNVTFEGKAAARVTDLIACTKHPGPEPLVEGSLTITINGLPSVRIGHASHCSGKVNSGRKSIWIDKTTGQFGPKNPELTAGEEFLAGLLGGLVGAKIGGAVGRGRREPTESAERQGVKDETTTPCKDPIDVATGEMVDFRDDLAIPGVLPLPLTRRYRTRSDDAGLLGPKWSVNWSQHLRLDDGHLVRFNDGGGLIITFEAPDAELNGINLREPRYRLEGTRAAPRILDDDTRRVLVFSPLADGAVARLERIEDHSGNAIAFDYDEHGRLIALRHTSGYRLALAYPGGAHTVASITLHEASGATHRLVDYAYDGPMLARVSSFQHGTFHYTYDHRGWITGWRDTDQTDVRYRYDEAGRVVETGTREGYHTGHLVYEDGRTRVLDADGEWLYEHNAEGLVTRETDPLGNSTQREWQLGRLTSETDPLGRRTDFSHDAHGKLTGVREPSGAVTQFQYDSQRRLAAMALPTGDRVALEYDKQHRLIARTEPDGTVKRYRYGERGELLRMVDGERETRLDYDDQLRLVVTRLPSGARLGTRFDVLGRLLEDTDPDGNATRYDHASGPHNPRGNVAQKTLADGTAHRTVYNSEGLPIEQTDPLGRTTRTTYGPFDLVTGTIDAAGHATRFEYDHATRLTRIVNALGEAWTYRYDAAGRLAAETDWGGRTTGYTRDAAGRLLTKTLPDGGAWHYRYDLADRLVAVDAGDVTLTYRYDAAGRLTAAAVHHDAATHVTRFRYDGNGRVIEEDQHGQLLKHIYDAQGQRTLRKTPHRETRYGYDALGALTQVGGLSITRDGLGRETGRQAGDFIAQRQYDALGRLLRQAAGPRAAFEAMQTDPVQALQRLTRQSYRYDAASQLAQVETDTDRFTYQHDPRGQVTSVSSIRQPAEHYTYNAAQNIAAHGRQGPIDGRHYLPGGLPERVGHTRYRYDARGRTIEKTIEQPGFRPKTWRYEWDGLNRLVKVHTPDKGTWAYRYDAFNRRVEKVNTGTGASVRFVWDGYTVAERWGQKRDGSTGTATTWHFEPDSHTPLAQETDAQHYAVFCNPTGLPLEIYRTTGEKVWASRYNLWGQALPEDALPDDEALDTSLRFAGQWADEESGLHYNLNRYYDPDSGCYLSIDPIAIRGGHRTQGYVQNPLWEVDPLGLAVCSARYARYKALREQGLSPAEAARESKLPELPEGYFYRTTNGGVQVVRSDMGALPKLGITPEGYLYSPLDVSGPYERPSGYRSGVRDEVWENAKQQDGNVYDPLTNKVMDKDEPWDMGHKPGYEFRKFKEKAAERNLTREEFLDEHNNPSHYRPELPSSNRSHAGEDMTDTYLGD
ncbi:GH-E family nuclease [Ralstonia pseudosolanacearum]|uniref:GH-E family nuclease n=1 Tax=Ralstonia pseudosolanacearum TaxID=1310165 RepID=UPI0008DAB89C|nr:GH-E family nuclease [Ralstonia pseudosolanacearum]MCL1622136.1 GH-E family nuclease [Ralstonia pseudosolanacearum CaRs-Mep]